MNSRAVLEQRNAGRNKPDEREKAHIHALLSSAEGRWLIGNLCHASKIFAQAPKDAYESGRHNLVFEQVVSKIVRHFGYAPFDDILKGKNDGNT